MALAAVAVRRWRGGGVAGRRRLHKAGAPIDLTGYWVSVVTEDWRYRMVTPAPGDYFSGADDAGGAQNCRHLGSRKEEASGDRCKSYGAAAVMRVPEHLHITWQDDHTLRMDTDAGKQTRVFHFGDWKAPAGPPTMQGDSLAEWEMQRTRAVDRREGRMGGSLKVTTTHLKAGFLRKNGVPYSENASLMSITIWSRSATGIS